MSKDRNWINSFAGLRFFVVLLLILHHFDSFNDLQIPGWSTLMLFLSEGFLSVNFFFILSGFVIEYSYGSKINTVNGISGAKFIIYRVAHLYPTYIFCLFIATFLYYGGSTAIQLIQGHDFLINLFMLQSWIPKDTYAFQFNGLAWAVSTEVFFYLTFVFLAGAKSSRLVFLNLLIWTAIIFITFTVGTNVSAPNWFYYINPVCRVAEFFLGVLLCRVYLSSDLQISVKVATALEIFAISVLLAFILLAVYFQPPWLYRWQLWYVIPCSILIYVFAYDKGLISYVLSRKVFQLLGELSFALYMVHVICLTIVKRMFLINSDREFYYAFCVAIIGTLMSIVVAYLMNRYLGRPANKFIRFHFDRVLRK